MHRALSSRWLRSALSIGDRAVLTELPGFLCPALSLSAHRTAGLVTRSRSLPYRTQQRCLHVRTEESERLEEHGTAEEHDATNEGSSSRALPLQCHGCGAFSQTSEPEVAGYYDMNRKAVKKFTSMDEDSTPALKTPEEDFVVDQALKGVDEEKLAELGIDPKTLHHGDELDPHATFLPRSTSTPLCDRCHNLIHHSTGNPIFHPSIDALRETIEESPFKHNHVYHIIDAADFPMSVIPRLHQLLGDISMRRKNRRSRSGRYYSDRQIEMSFIITRADLLAPKEEQVNSLMPYLRQVLRDSLGEFGKGIRLGNLKCVSAKRAWWTKELKQEIYRRGGAGWMVGKVNVGKSQLFEAVFPKGTTVDMPSSRSPIEVSMFAREEDAKYLEDDLFDRNDDRLEIGSLLPPARSEVNYPEMPTVSSLPGTTASPIRIPFGNGKGELIDLPGMARSDLELFIQEEHRQSTIMQKRIKPEQYSIKPGQSLLLGGLIRITPRTPDLIFLGYNFTPLSEHLSSTWKAAAVQEQTRENPRQVNIATPEAASKMAHAGTFLLRHDVTKLRAGPITRSNAINIKVDRLPYRVLSTDILIEGIGWVEVTAQVRTRDLYDRSKRIDTLAPPPKPEPVPEPEPEDTTPVDPFEAMARRVVDEKSAKDKKKPEPVVEKKKKKTEEQPNEPELNWPVIDVFSPLGKFIGSRAPLNGWMLNKPKIQAKHKRARPRKSMKGAKKREKIARRAAAAATA